MSEAFETAREDAKVVHAQFLQMQFGAESVPPNPHDARSVHWGRASGSQLEEQMLPPSPSQEETMAAKQHKRCLEMWCCRPKWSARGTVPPWRRAPITPVAPLVDRSLLPKGYGDWDDWNSEAAIAKESELAEVAELKMYMRGPLPSASGGPELWKGITFDEDKNMWIFSSRKTIPPEYAFQDWWAKDSLIEESRLARYYHIPWNLRGPPSGPSGGHVTWRGLQWRAGQQKWMVRGGKNKDMRDKFYRASKR